MACRVLKSDPGALGVYGCGAKTSHESRISPAASAEVQIVVVDAVYGRLRDTMRWKMAALQSESPRRRKLRSRAWAVLTPNASVSGASVSDSRSREVSTSMGVEEVPVVAATTNFVNSVPKGKTSISRIMEPVEDDLEMLNENLKKVVGERHPMLMSAAEQIFSAGGKRMRPALVFLVSRGTAELAKLDDIRPQHRRLAEITEMIHTASLIHDDVLDNSDVRRGKMTVHQKFGTRVAVLSGDFLFAQSSWFLANLDNLPVIKLISRVIADFANGEIAQKASQFDCDVTQEEYLDKSYAKTASLIAASLKSAAIFSGVSDAVCEQMFNYGKHLGLAFQVVDDILDFTQSTEQLGKPAGSDLASGNLTAPVIFALKREPRLRQLIDSEFIEPGSLEEAIALVKSGGGIVEAQLLAQQQGHLARQCLSVLPMGPARDSLDKMVDYVLERLY